MSEPTTFSAWVAVIGLILTGLGWAAGWAFARGRNAQSTDEHHGQISHIHDALNEKERRVDALGERLARAEARIDHFSENIKRADAAIDRLTVRIEALADSRPPQEEKRR